MSFVDKYSKAFRALLPTPFTIAISLTIITFFLASFWSTKPESPIINIEYFEGTYTVTSNKNIVWNNGVTNDTIELKSNNELQELIGSYTNPTNNYSSSFH